MISLGLIAITLFASYRVTLEENRHRLTESARTYAQLIEAVARFDSVYSGQDHPKGSWGATYSQVLDALRMSDGMAWLGKVSIIRKEGQQIILVSKLSAAKTTEWAVPKDDPHYASFQRGLSGTPGDFSGVDHLGESVVMAYHPVPSMGLLVVLGLPLWEIQQPFVDAALLALAAGSVLLLGGLMLTLSWAGRSRVNEGIASPDVREILHLSKDALVLLDETQNVVMLNHHAEHLLGLKEEEKTGQPWVTLFKGIGSWGRGQDDTPALPATGEKLHAAVWNDDNTHPPVVLDVLRFDQEGESFTLLRVAQGVSTPPEASVTEAALARHDPTAGPLTTSVRKLIIAGLADGDSAVKIIAPKLDMSVRSLQRQLGDEGTSFSTLIHQVREELCLQYLKEGRLNMEEIASRLGYSDLTNFHRAFKRWTGFTPGRYRKQLTGPIPKQEEDLPRSTSPGD